MTMAVICLDCGRPTTEAKRGRCPSCRRERRRKSHYQSPAWKRMAARARRDGECAICGSRKRLVVHHKQARKEGGQDDESNFALLCGEGAIAQKWDSCHSQYEADKRLDKDTDLRRQVEAL